MNRNITSQASGFTLLELMVVMVILASFIFPNVMDAPDQARLVKVKIELQSIEGAQHGEFDAYSLGADGQPNGEGINADLGNWSMEHT